MLNDTRAYHIEIYVRHAARQMRLGMNSGCMIAVFPESTLAIFSAVVLLRGAASNELHAFGNFAVSAIMHQKMDVV